MKYTSKTTVWITGASSGIGEALAYRYAELGVSVILSSRKEVELHRVAAQCRRLSPPMEEPPKFSVISMDMASEASIVEAWERVKGLHRKVDILIHNAGISQRSLVRHGKMDIDRKVMELNFFGPVFLTRLVLPSLLENGGGHLVAISSIVGKFGFPLRSAYAASKHAIKGFFESLKAEEYAHKIRVTLVYPGFIRTNISRNALNEEGVPSGKMDENQKGGMPVEVCARKIVKAIAKEKHEVLVGGKELTMVYFRRFLPLLHYKLVRRVSPT
ncbi:MAG: short chain dehydrogenase [Bacteroidetes bacterium]|nr:MAG: short chain dehydrogenase [Bacteroidota bacterium]PIE88235.1 MAG: short chain dehydrogenase [Bacteroidota bacterium]